jgi:hypothetical protein
MPRAIGRGIAVACAVMMLAVEAAAAEPVNPIVLSGVQHETDGVAAEYGYIREHFPGCRATSQALLRDKDRSYDAIKLDGTNCATKDVLFDITDWLGK